MHISNGVQNPLKFIFFFRSVQLVLCLCCVTFANSFDLEDESVRAEYDLFRIEGVYEIKTLYTDTGGQRDGRIDRLVIYRNYDMDVVNAGSETFTISLAMDRFNTTFFLFRNGQVKVEGDLLKVTANGKIGNGVYGKIYIEFNRDTLNLSGNFKDSNANGFKSFQGKPLHNLSMCLYQPKKPDVGTDVESEEPPFEFPSIDELVGVYKEENGEDLLILQFIEKDLTLNKKKFLSNDRVYDVPFNAGVYYQKYGVLAFTWDDLYSDGKVSVSYRLDENGKKYLKALSVSSGGLRSIRKFYFHEEILEEELPPVLFNN